LCFISFKQHPLHCYKSKNTYVILNKIILEQLNIVLKFTYIVDVIVCAFIYSRLQIRYYVIFACICILYVVYTLFTSCTVFSLIAIECSICSVPRFVLFGQADAIRKRGNAIHRTFRLSLKPFRMFCF